MFAPTNGGFRTTNTANVSAIADLDYHESTLKGQLSLIQLAMEKYYSDELTQDGPFTVFVPSNGGFRTTNTANVSCYS